MANKNLFNTKAAATATCNGINNAGGKAYILSDKAALAQYVLTGCINSTYYTTDKNQLDTLIALSSRVDTKFIAQLAIYARQHGLMKDTPAMLLAILAKRDVILLTKTFNQVIDSPKMLRTFVQILRSGVSGRKSLGTRPKKLIQNYLESLTDEQLFKADIGNNPSLPDLIKMVHPRPTNKNRSALYAYLLGKNYNEDDLNSIVKDYEQFKQKGLGHIPNVPFQMLTSLPLSPENWKQIATHATWNQVRMNLNTFARHGVFDNQTVITKIAQKLSDKNQVKASKVFPYALYAAYIASKNNIPVEISNALQDAAEHSLENIPTFNGKVYVMVDVSGSMHSPISGYRSSATSKVRCIDAAAVLASAILRKNPNAEVIPFDTQVHTHARINARDSIVSNAEKLASFGGGGTDCSIALNYINQNKATADLVIYISDNESWIDSTSYTNWHESNSTATMKEWDRFKDRNKNAKLININIQPSITTQAVDRNDILNIGGFTDTIFEVISKFSEMDSNPVSWVQTIESINV